MKITKDEITGRETIDYFCFEGSRFQAYSMVNGKTFVGWLPAESDKWSYWTDDCTIQEFAEKLEKVPPKVVS